MAMYIAMQLEEGKLNYNEIFAIKRWQKYQEDTDAILAADGYVVNADGIVTKVK